MGILNILKKVEGIDRFYHKKEKYLFFFVHSFRKILKSNGTEYKFNGRNKIKLKRIKSNISRYKRLIIRDVKIK